MALPDRHALVVGASGLLGGTLARRLAPEPGWRLTTLARRPDMTVGSRHLACDLLDRDACLGLAPDLAAVTHVFFCSRAVASGYTIDADANTAMLANLLDALAAGAPRVEHVQLMHGLKWYGTHVGPIRIPARETDPPHADSSFYERQQDMLSSRGAASGWSWTTIRPHFICSVTTQSPSNLVGVLGTFAAVLRARGDDLWFPGSPESFDAVTNVVEIDLLLDAMIWAATEHGCADQPFNVTNGDCFRWRDAWPIVAGSFGMRVGEVRPTDLRAFMAGQGPSWDALAAAHDLRPTRFGDLADWSFAQKNVFGLCWDVVASTVKAHRYGFHGVRDSLDMFARLLGRYRAERILP